jgi:hypothetical protein
MPGLEDYQFEIPIQEPDGATTVEYLDGSTILDRVTYIQALIPQLEAISET